MNLKLIVKVLLFLTVTISGCTSTQNVDEAKTKPIAIPSPPSNYKVTCLETKSDDTKSFGAPIAVSDNYLAIGDYKGNRVVIYKRSNDGSWQRKGEIEPPADSVAQKLGKGFVSSLVINNNTLVIKSISNKNRLKNKKIYLLAELYVANLDNLEAKSLLKKISYPEPNKTAINSLTFFGENIAFAARTRNNSGKGINRVYILNPTSGEIVSSIESPEMQYPPNQESDRSNGYRINLNVHKNSLLIGDLDSRWYNSIFRVNPNEKLEPIKFNREQVDGKQPSAAHFNLTEYSLLAFATSDKLSAIGRNIAFYQDTLVFNGFPDINEFKIIESSGVLDAYKSHVLISRRRIPGSMNSYQGQSDHTLVGLEDNEIVIKSEIFWERAQDRSPLYPQDPFIRALGKLGEQGLFLAARGKVVYLPIKNLPEKYEIKLSTCAE